MLRSMYSGISGLKNFQTKLDVIGNNISNVNTFGFKKGRVVFKDIFSQTSAGASAPSNTMGGVNPKQIGLGSQLAAIDTITNSGSLQTTNRTLDLAISGDGYFVVADATKIGGVPTAFSKQTYTRAGNFYLDKDGYLVNADGKYVYGVADNTPTAPTDDSTTFRSATLAPSVQIDATNGSNVDSGGDYDIKPIRIPTDAQSMSIGKDGTITFVDTAGTLRYAGQLVLAKFANPGGLTKEGSNSFKDSSNSGTPQYNIATAGGNGDIASGNLEMSNVDLSEEFTEMIVTQRAFQANSRIITTSDEILQELVNLKR